MTVLSKLASATEVGSGKRRIIPPVPLERPVAKELQKGQYYTFKLKAKPADANSPTYDLSVPYFRDGSCEEFLLFEKNLDRVMLGQAITDATDKASRVRKLLQGGLLTAFENYLTANVTTENPLNDDIFKNVLAEAKGLIFPKRAAVTQKRYRQIRPPACILWLVHNTTWLWQ